MAVQLILVKTTGTGLVLPQSWDISGATYDSKSLAVETETNNSAEDVVLRPDGTRMIILGDKKLFQYTLSSAWDLSTASYDSVSYDTTAEGINFDHGMYVKPDDGLRLYLIKGGSALYYTMSSAWDVTTLTWQASITPSGAVTPTSIAFKQDDGTKFFTLQSGGGQQVRRYTPNSPWDWTFGHTFDAGQTFSVTSQFTTPTGLNFSTDGTKMFVTGYAAAKKMEQYTLSTPWDLTTASHDSGATLSLTSEFPSGNELPFGADFSATTNNMYVIGINVGAGADSVFQYKT